MIEFVTLLFVVYELPFIIKKAKLHGVFSCRHKLL